MILYSLERLQYLCSVIPPLLMKIDDHEFSVKPNPKKWSKKEIIGHLIDSATNNHHRLVRAQFEKTPQISYDQDLWNEHGYYQLMDSKQIISFWTIYNKQLVELIKHMPENKWSSLVNTGGDIFTLQFIVGDYIKHMEHHLHQVVSY